MSPITRQPLQLRLCCGCALRGPLAALVVLLALGSACASAVTEAPLGPERIGLAPVFPGADWERVPSPEAVGYLKEGLDSVVAYVSRLATTGLFVTVGGRVLLEYGDIARVSYLASVRKSVLAMLYGNHVENGTIDLSTTLRELEWTDHGGLLPIEVEATIEHVITARSGVYHPASNGGDNLGEAPPRGSQRPGAYFLYSNWDFNTAGAIFEKLTGRDLYDALESDLAKPLGMQDFDRAAQRKSGDLTRSMYPAYHMYLSTRDMARIGYLMLREGNWNGKQVIPRSWARRIRSVVTPVEQMNPPEHRRGPFGYGVMWWVWDGEAATGVYKGAYTGIGAVGQYITVLPALDMVVAHKTVPGGGRSVSRSEYLGILEGLIAARCQGGCTPRAGRSPRPLGVVRRLPGWTGAARGFFAGTLGSRGTRPFPATGFGRPGQPRGGTFFRPTRPDTSRRRFRRRRVPGASASRVPRYRGLFEGRVGSVWRHGTRGRHGVRRLSMRGNGMSSRTWRRPVIQARVRSTPRPKPEWGKVPYLRRSRYQS